MAPGSVKPVRDWTGFRVGLTGGIASGKTAVAGLFSALGVPVIDTDRIARDIVSPGSPALAEIAAAFGPQVLQPDGALDRRRLREIAFAEPAERRRLEAIMHPRISAEMEAQSRRAGGPYQVLVVPLLIESGLVDRVDRVLVVDCPGSLQRSRLLARDGESPEGAGRLLAAQLPRPARLARADDIVDNSGSLEDARRRVAELHASYLKLGGMNGRG